MTDADTVTARVTGAPALPSTLDALLGASAARAPRAPAVAGPGRAPLELDLRLVFDAPTVATLAAVIEGRSQAGAPGEDLDRIVDALATLEAEQVGQILAARDDRDAG